MTEGNGVGASIQAESGTERKFRKWQCELCAFIYDEELGWPDDGIPAGTRWEDVSEDWICPECGAVKQDFVMVEIA